MDELKRLTKLVVEQSSKSSPLINQHDEKSLETKLFNLIKQGEIVSDEDAAEALYGNKSLSANYRMLKSRLRKKLFNHLHFLDFSKIKFSASRIENYHCNALLLEVQTLIIADEYKIADKLLNQAIDVAKANGLTSIMVRALEQKQTINTTTHSIKAYEATSELLQEYYEVEAKERAAVQLYHHAKMKLSRGVIGKNAFMHEMPEILQKVKAFWEDTRSSYIFNAYHILSIHYLELCGDYGAISEAVAKAEQLLEEGILRSGWFNHRYNYFIRVYALLQTKQYELGISLAQKYVQEFEPNRFNWFAFMENYLLLALHSKKYELAGELMQEGLANPYVDKIQDAAKERWELYRRFLLLMHAYMPSQTVLNLPKGVLAELVMLPKDKL